jgi:hypothetical protein
MCSASYGCKVIDLGRKLLVGQQLNMWYNSGGMDVQCVWDMSGRQNPKASYVLWWWWWWWDIYVLRFEWDDEVLQKGQILLQQFCFMKYYFVIRWLQWVLQVGYDFCQFAHMCCLLHLVFVGLAFQGNDILCLEFIIEFSSLSDFDP